MEKDQMRRQLRTAVLKAEILGKELQMILKYEVYMMREMKERENIVACSLGNATVISGFRIW
jgi:hypothetical protein